MFNRKLLTDAGLAFLLACPTLALTEPVAQFSTGAEQDDPLPPTAVALAERQERARPGARLLG